MWTKNEGFNLFPVKFKSLKSKSWTSYFSEMIKQNGDFSKRNINVRTKFSNI